MKKSTKINKALWLIPMLLLLGNFCSAQTMLDNNLYNHNWFGLHPAYAGHGGDAHLSLQAKRRQLSAGNSYTGSLLTFDSRVGERIGLGGTVITNNQSGFENITVAGTSAYTTPLADNHKLSFGITLGVTQSNVNFNSMDLNQFVDRDDDLLRSDAFRETNIRIGSGFLYEFKEFKLAFTAPSLIQETNTLREVFTASVSYKVIAENVSFEPSLLVRKYDINPSETTLMIHAEIQEKFWMQFGYRDNDTMLFGAGFNLNEIKVGYSYGLPTKAQSNIVNNSHEILVGISFGKNSPKS